MGEILYGNELANEIKKDIKNKIDLATGKRKPHLAIIYALEDEGSTSYLMGLKKAGATVGIEVSVCSDFSEETEKGVIDKINELNNDDEVDGIMIALPLPANYKAQNIVNAVDDTKDVDGLCEKNVGRLYTKQEGFRPCTPLGILHLLINNKIELEGKEVVIVGRSNSVGKPVAQLLLDENATVTICHTRTKNIKEICQRADILVVAVGKSHLVTSEWIKKDAIVVDVGVNSNEEGKLVGDVDTEDVLRVAKWVTPVTRGVGALTTAMLLKNVYISYERRISNGL
jgi:5,10-methylene-tetrahydrofolate dehydrogenase/Methenyl tetrahydrofolate cyclohydrolase